MKFNNKILSIPPYISTTWANISSIRMKATQLSIALKDGDTIDIPNLSNESIDQIFHAHAEYMEEQVHHDHMIQKMSGAFSKQMIVEGQQNEHPFRMGFGTPDGFNAVVAHNPEQANGPDLPAAILDKIGSFAKLVELNSETIIPPAEPNCNCPHCQITRAITQEKESLVEKVKVIGNEVAKEEVVSDQDLHFQQWEIVADGESRFMVTNKLDALETYKVFLGNPVGCTCGHPGCEHIVAVLQS